jgi:hypothetical protein
VQTLYPTFPLGGWFIVALTTSRLLKVDHYMLHVRIMMCLGGCAASSQNADADTGVGGCQEFITLVHYRRSGLPDIGVCTRRYEGPHIWSGAQVLETTFFA